MNNDIYFKELKAGDVRRRDDQVRQMWCGGRLSSFADSPPNPEPWHNVSPSTIGWKILPGDLFNAEFRRPLI